MNSNKILELAKNLINSVTINAAKALGLNTGEIKEGKNADMIGKKESGISLYELFPFSSTINVFMMYPTTNDLFSPFIMSSNV